MIKRNESIDIIKGFLTICVIIGHILLGRIQDNYIRYIIYSFHMHIFLFMSGYMINITKLSHLSYKEILHKYWGRMLKVWTIAFVLYTGYQFIHLHNFQIGLLYSPWYHLWYIPTLFSYIIICKIMFTNFSERTSYITLLIISVIYIATKQILNTPLPRWSDCSYLPFFTLGILLRNTKIISTKHFIVLPLFILIITLSKYFDIKSYGTIELVSLILVIIFWLYPTIINNSLPSSRVLSYLGKNSLNIYLWHVIPIILLKALLEGNQILYYISSFILLLLFVLYSYYKERQSLKL